MKSHANGPLSKLVTAIITDAGHRCDIGAASVTRDITTVISRVKHEGISFITIALPQFCSHFERSLDKGEVTSQLSYGFKKVECLPVFLQGFTRLVFDSGTGVLLDEPSIDAILCIRQICLFAKKVSLPCTPAREHKALESYKEIEQILEIVEPPSDYIDKFDAVASCLWGTIFSDFSEIAFDLLPKHGPGATCERISGNQKYSIKSWHERLEPYFPIDLHVYPNLDSMMSKRGIKTLDVLQVGEELPVRVTLVPKTLKGPRIIAIEPVCMQYTQQALARFIMRRIERDRLVGGHVNFTDQSINQSLALRSSADGKLATLDLSSASDRVPFELVRRMLRCNEDLFNALDATRSRSAKLPSGEVIHLKKFASMGSATCFPIEAMYFLTVILTSMVQNTEPQYVYDEILHLIKDVYVYGDDIIIPVDAVESAIQALESFGSKVNASKSFWNGHFRESCGCDAYAGERVTPVYVRCMPPESRKSASAIISWVETSNLFYRSGFWQTSDYMKSVVEAVIGKLPIVSDDSAAIGLTSFQKQRTVHGWHKELQCPYVRAYVPIAVQVRDQLQNEGALLKCLLLLESSSDRDPLVAICLQKDHLTRSAKHGASRIKRRRLPIS